MSVDEFVTHIHGGGVLKSVPKLAQEAIGQLDPGLAVARKVGDQLDDPFHDHGFVVGEFLALELRLDHVFQRLVVCTSS